MTCNSGPHTGYFMSAVTPPHAPATGARGALADEDVAAPALSAGGIELPRGHGALGTGSVEAVGAEAARACVSCGAVGPVGFSHLPRKTAQGRTGRTPREVHRDQAAVCKLQVTTRQQVVKSI